MQCPPLRYSLRWLGCNWFLLRDLQCWWATIPSGVRGNCGGLPLPPADHVRSTLSHLAHRGGAAPAAPSCRILGRVSDQVSVWCPEHLAVAAAGRLCSQRSENNNMWCLVAVSSFSFLPTPEVTGAAGGSHSQAPSGDRPHLPLASKKTYMVSPCCL